MVKTYQTYNLGQQLRTLIINLSNLKTRGQRTELRNKLIRLSKQIEKMEEGWESAEQGRIDALKEVIYLENTAKLQQTGNERIHKYTKWRSEVEA